ncbi:tetratricopeptide repeat protein [uncultured Phocaeicola sp.]|uniref:tetratricopeptide repeat protein n=2 Tax=uncultured Phocaeicola sp. TaxID=990718 RepID=UPI0026263932|nr:tetratricopeptide repeat protein [uncultured Phocaeicola sp.]
MKNNIAFNKTFVPLLLMKACLVFILFIGISLSLGCSRHRPYPLFMEQAQSCVETAPDSALHYLSLLKDSIWREPEETQMYYHLLTIKAKDKLYIRHTSDSLVNLIVKYYNEHGDKNKQIEAYYYQGSVYRDLHDAPSALGAFHEVISRSKELPAADRKQSADLMARTYNQMGTLFAYQGLYDESLQANRESVNCYLAQGKKDKISYALRDIARMYDAKHQKDSALHYYRKAYRTVLSVRSPHKAYRILGELGSFYYYSLAKADSAKQMLITALNHQPDMENALLVLGDVYRGEARWDSACYYLHQAIEYGDIYKQHSAYRHLSSIEIQKHNYPQAITYIQRAQLLADSIKEITRTEAIAQINSLYNYQHIQKENYTLLLKNEKKNALSWILGCISLAIAGVAVGIYFYYRKKVQATRLQTYKCNKLKEEREAMSMEAHEENIRKIKELEQAKALQDLLLAQKEQLEAKNQEIIASLKKQKVLQDSLRQTSIYHFFHQACTQADSKMTEEKWSELQKEVDTAYPNFSKCLYELSPKLSVIELQICYLMKISIPPTHIAIFTNRTKAAISNARTRLAKRLLGEQSSTEELDALISDLQ